MHSEGALVGGLLANERARNVHVEFECPTTLFQTYFI